MAQLIKIGIPKELWDKDHTKPWYSDFRMGKKRIKRALSVHKPKARIMLEDLLAMRRAEKHGGYVEDCSWFVFKEKWIRLRQEKVDRYELSLNSHSQGKRAIQYLENAVPTLRRVKQITPELLLDVAARWRREGLGKYAIGNALGKIKAMMAQAEDWKLVAPQNWRIVKIPPPRKRQMYYTLDQLKHLLSLTSGYWKTAALLMGRAGLRPGEVRHLEWSDINFTDRTISIRIKEHLNWKPKKSTPESPHERIIDLPPDLEAHLRSLPRHQGFVLGHYVKDYEYRNYFQWLSRRAGIKGFAYVFRHSYASHLISNGVELESVGQLLGHTDYKSTKIYSHLMPHARRSAVDRLPPL